MRHPTFSEGDGDFVIREHVTDCTMSFETRLPCLTTDFVVPKQAITSVSP